MASPEQSETYGTGPDKQIASSGPAAGGRSGRGKAAATTEMFNGPVAPLQVKLPQDLVVSLRLHAIGTGETISEIVLRCLTTPESVTKAWVSTRQAG